MSEPKVRASSFINALQTIRALPPAQSAQILAKIPQPLIASIDKASSLDWMPIIPHLPLYHAVAAVLHGDAYLKFWKKATGGMFENPLLKGAFQFVARFTGLSRKQLVKNLQSSWKLFTKDSGELSPQESGDETRLDTRWTNIPQALVGESAYLSTITVGFSHAFDVLRLPARMTLKVNAADRTGVISIEWDK